MTSGSVSRAPAAVTITAVTASPQRSSGRPSTVHSATPGSAASAASTSAG